MSILPGSPFLRVLSAAIRARVPVLGWGIPGIGKTAMIEQLAEQYGLACETVIGSIRDATDYLGMPIESGGTLRFAPPDWAARCAQRGKRNLVFFDEFNTGSAAVMKAELRVIQEQYCGDLALPEDTAFVAAANPPEVAVDANDLPAPLANRFLHLDWVLDPEAWHFGLVNGFDKIARPDWRGMLSGGTSDDAVRASAAVGAFLTAMPQHLAPNPPTTLGAASTKGHFARSYAYPSPRSWHNLARVLTHLRRDDDAAVSLAVYGLVGEGAGREFMAWWASASMYDPRAVLDGRESPTWKGDPPDRLYALMSAVTAIALAEGGPSIGKGLRVCLSASDGGRKDAAVPALRALLTRVDESKVPAAVMAGIRSSFSDIVIR